ncbi:MAG TPA: hypothetical protein VGH49_01935, partial [Xanthobacteraceae bacterium]
AMVAQTCASRQDRKRRIEDGCRHCLVAHHRVEAPNRRSDRLKGVIGAGKTVLREDLVEQEGPSGVRYVHHQGPVAQIGQGLDLGLDEKPIEAAVAAKHDHGVGSADLDHGHGLICGALGDLVVAVGKSVALLVRVRRIRDIDIQSAARECTNGMRRKDREALRAWKHSDGDRNDATHAGVIVINKAPSAT